MFGAQLACCGLVRNTRPGETSSIETAAPLHSLSQLPARWKMRIQVSCFMLKPNVGRECASSTRSVLRLRGNC